MVKAIALTLTTAMSTNQSPDFSHLPPPVSIQHYDEEGRTIFIAGKFEDYICPKCKNVVVWHIPSQKWMCRHCTNAEETPPPLTDEQMDAYLNSVSCPDCWGTGRVYAYVGSQPSKCTSCDGTGYL